MRSVVITLLALVVFAIGSPALAKKRLALVMGNAKYTAVSPLKNPVNDANLMAATLEKLGFEVTKVTDANLREMRLALIQFGRKLRAEKVEASLFYYAGHGIQADGRNYILPVGVNLKAQDELSLEALAMNDFVSTIASGKADFNIMIFDACRNNPFSGEFRSANAGLARIKSPEGSYIAFSAEAGEVAEDGTGDNSIFTKALAQNMSQPGMTIETVFKKTREAVYIATDQRQRTWDESSIIGEFYFNEATKKTIPPVKAATSTLTQRIDQVLASRNVETEARSEWELLKGSTSVAALDLFISRHPETVEAAYAKVRRDELVRSQGGVVAPPPEKPAAKVVQPATEQPSAPEADAAENQTGTEPPQVVAKLETQPESAAEEEPGPPPVLALQAKLKATGCYTGKLDGDWGPRSRRAIRQFLEKTGIEADDASPSDDLLKAIQNVKGQVCEPAVVSTPPATSTLTVKPNSVTQKKSRSQSVRKPRETRRKKRVSRVKRRVEHQRVEERAPTRVRRERRGSVGDCTARRIRQGESPLDARFACMGG